MVSRKLSKILSTWEQCHVDEPLCFPCSLPGEISLKVLSFIFWNLIHLPRFPLELQHAHYPWGLQGLRWDALGTNGRALTSCSDGTHLRGDCSPGRPAAADVAAALHLGDGLRQLVRAAPVCQSRVTVSGADIWEDKETPTHASRSSKREDSLLPPHLHMSLWGWGGVPIPSLRWGRMIITTWAIG